MVSEIGVPLRPLATGDYGHVTEQDTINLLTRAFDMGFTYFDVADSYTEGYGERTLARSLGRRRHDIVISTKAGYDFYRPAIYPDRRGRSRVWTPGFIQYACEQSLRRLDTDYIDVLQLHHPAPDQIEDDELFGCLDDLIAAGKIRYYGVALGDDAQCEETGEGAIDVRAVSSIQTRFSLLDQQPGRNLISRAQGTPTAIIAYDPSASGALDNISSTATADATASSELRREAFESRAAERETMVRALRKFGGDAATWSIKFALASPVVAATLPVVTSYPQLIALGETADMPDLPSELVETAFEAYDEAHGAGGVWRE